MVSIVCMYPTLSTRGERWIKQEPRRLFLDRACTQPFPVPLPDASRARFHRIVVAHERLAELADVADHSSACRTMTTILLALIAINARITPKRQERTLAQFSEVSLGRRHALLLSRRLGHGWGKTKSCSPLMRWLVILPDPPFSQKTLTTNRNRERYAPHSDCRLSSIVRHGRAAKKRTT